MQCDKISIFNFLNQGWRRMELCETEQLGLVSLKNE
jgi:hypothetical protein